MGTLAASGSDFGVPGRRLSFFKSYSFFIGFCFLGCCLSRGDQANQTARLALAENDQQQSASGRMSDSEKSVLRFAMLRVKEFYRASVCPDGLGLFKPDSMFAIVDPILGFVPFKPHIYLYASVYTQSIGGLTSQSFSRDLDTKKHFACKDASRAAPCITQAAR